MLGGAKVIANSFAVSHFFFFFCSFGLASNMQCNWFLGWGLSHLIVPRLPVLAFLWLLIILLFPIL